MKHFAFWSSSILVLLRKINTQNGMDSENKDLIVYWKLIMLISMFSHPLISELSEWVNNDAEHNVQTNSSENDEEGHIK